MKFRVHHNGYGGKRIKIKTPQQRMCYTQKEVEHIAQDSRTENIEIIPQNQICPMCGNEKSDAKIVKWNLIHYQYEIEIETLEELFKMINQKYPSLHVYAKNGIFYLEEF